MATRKPAAKKKPAVRKRASVSAESPREELKRVMEEVQELRTMALIHGALEKIGEEITQARGIAESNQATLRRIETQVTFTNGRVTLLEMWKNKSTGVMATIAAGASLFGWIFGQIVGFFK